MTANPLLNSCEIGYLTSNPEFSLLQIKYNILHLGLLWELNVVMLGTSNADIEAFGRSSLSHLPLLTLKMMRKSTPNGHPIPNDQPLKHTYEWILFRNKCI